MTGKLSVSPSGSRDCCRISPRDAEAPWLSVDFRKRMRQSGGLQIQLVPSTCEQRKLNKHKVNDLLSLKPFIPPIYHTFYDSLQPDAAVDEILEAEDEILINSEDEFVDTPAFRGSSQNSEQSGELSVVSPEHSTERSTREMATHHSSSKSLGSANSHEKIGIGSSTVARRGAGSGSRRGKRQVS